jgi:hypothetical protein
VLLGGDHPMYNRNDPRDLSNASFSLCLTGKGIVTTEVLVDAGHGTMQSLITGRNRIPECICLTHGHLDHTLSVDWLVQSHWRREEEVSPYPVYATRPVFASLIRSYPYLEKLVRHVPLKYGATVRMEHAPGFRISAFPVYHGPAAPGASMLLFETDGQKVLFTGDLFGTLLRKRDLAKLEGIDLLVVDANNRFPWPRTNHWSVAGQPVHWMTRSNLLEAFIEKITWETISVPHLPNAGKETDDPYFLELMEEGPPGSQSFTMLEFLGSVIPRNLMPVHYSGAEDLKHHGEAVLNQADLQRWLEKVIRSAGIPSGTVMPEPGQIIPLG